MKFDGPKLEGYLPWTPFLHHLAHRFYTVPEPETIDTAGAKQTVLNLTRPALETIKIGWFEVIAVKVIGVDARRKTQDDVPVGWFTNIYLENGKTVVIEYGRDDEERQDRAYHQFVADWKKALSRI